MAQSFQSKFLSFCLVVFLFVLSCLVTTCSQKNEQSQTSIQNPEPKAEAPMDAMKCVDFENENVPVVKESVILDTCEKKPEPQDMDAPMLKLAQKLATSEEYRTRAPQLLSRIESSNEEPLPFVSYDISVVIASHKARVVMDMVYKNPSSRVLAGTMMVELADGASPCYLGMFQGTGPVGWETSDRLPGIMNPDPPNAETLLGQEIRLLNTWQIQQSKVDWGELRSARVVNPVKGREVYETVTRRRVDPALAEWAGGNKFSTRIFPIPANGYKRVVFAYDRPLTTKNGYLFYSLPVPKEMPKDMRINVHLVGQTLVNPKILASQTEIQGMDVDYGKRWEWKADGNYKGSLIFQAKSAHPNLQVLAGKDAQIPAKLAHVRYYVDMPSRPATQRNTGKALFVLDTSYSSRDKLAALSGKILRAILEADTGITEFAVVGFDVRTHKITQGFVANTKQNQESALQTVEQIWLEGATNFASLLQFLQSDPSFQQAETIFLLSDGQITWGVENPKEFANKFSAWVEKRWICYSFGDISVNQPLFQTLSANQGQIVNATLGQDIAATAKAHLAAQYPLNAIYGQNQEEIVVSGNPRNVYPGQILEIAAKAPENAQSMDIVVEIAGKKTQISVPLDVSPITSSLAARAWADLYAQRLLELYDETANQLVLALSQRFCLSNREASFIILETDAEYVQYKIELEKLDIAKLTKIAKEESARRPFGAPDTQGLSNESMSLVDELAQARDVRVWQTNPPLQIGSSLEALLQKPVERRGKNTASELYLWAQELYKQRNASNTIHPLRVLSTIVEVAPQDDQALRLVGYVLLEWSMYQEAEELFARVRQRRPFEPQNYLLEGMALAVQGKISDAALRYEIVLSRDFSRFNDFVRPVASIVYSDLLNAVMQKYPNSSLVTRCQKRLQTLSAAGTPRGRLFLFWNLDNTDVDLHVLESGGTEVYYQNKESSTGGKLFWDNTAGLGPELYEHPALSREGFDVFVNYFGSSAVEGVAPSSTLVTAFTFQDNTRMYVASWYTTVLLGSGKDKVYIMPKWKP